ncbi:MAG: Holliday junction resolvase RuvX [Candidatus Omnitrophota bacterium]
MKILCLDVGDKRVGVALSDPLGITAQGVGSIPAGDDDRLFKRIKEIADGNNVNEIVVGLPLNMDGSVGPRARKSIAFSDELRGRLGIAVKLWDERLTTMQAERVLLVADMSRKSRRRNLDKMAAQLILQGYLDTQKSSSA